MKIFISWIGTDKGGTSLISASGKLSNFSNYNFSSMYESIMNVNTDPMVDDKAMKYIPNEVDPDVKEKITNPPEPPTKSDATNNETTPENTPTS